MNIISKSSLANLHGNLLVSSKLGDVSISHDGRNFFVIDSNGIQSEILRINLSQELRGVTEETLRKILAVGYLSLSKQETDYTLRFDGRVLGGITEKEKQRLIQQQARARAQSASIQAPPAQIQKTMHDWKTKHDAGCDKQKCGIAKVEEGKGRLMKFLSNLNPLKGVAETGISGVESALNNFTKMLQQSIAEFNKKNGVVIDVNGQAIINRFCDSLDQAIEEWDKAIDSFNLTIESIERNVSQICDVAKTITQLCSGAYVFGKMVELLKSSQTPATTSTALTTGARTGAMASVSVLTWKLMTEFIFPKCGEFYQSFYNWYQGKGYRSDQEVKMNDVEEMINKMDVSDRDRLMKALLDSPPAPSASATAPPAQASSQVQATPSRRPTVKEIATNNRCDPQRCIDELTTARYTKVELTATDLMCGEFNNGQIRFIISRIRQ